MNASLIKIRYGLTIDSNKQHFEPCPKCGKVVCGVVENNEDVFCMNTFCNFKDKINHSYANQLIERFKYIHSWGGTMFFNTNHLYPAAQHPFITQEDLRANRLIIRDFILDEEYFYSKYAKRSDVPPSKCYKQDCPIIAKYGSVSLMIEDNWKPNIDGEDEINVIYKRHL